MTQIQLLQDLQLWTEETATFHGDRELSDRVLIAAGWRCIPDPGHAAKLRWEFGTCPAVLVWPPYVPHPVRSIDAALSQIPPTWRLWCATQIFRDGHWTIDLAGFGAVVSGSHAAMSIAICVAVVRVWELEARYVAPAPGLMRSTIPAAADTGLF
jgi:hypothetical protein